MNDQQNWKQRLEELFTKDKLSFVNNLEGIRGNQVSIDFLRSISINLQEGNSKLFHLASLRTSARDLTVHVFDKKNVRIITKALLDSDLGYKLVKTDGDTIYFSLLPMTEETRLKMIKKCKEIFESSKVSVRNSRQKILNEIKNSKNISIDQEKKAKKEIDEVVNFWNEKLSDIFNKKVSEIKM